MNLVLIDEGDLLDGDRVLLRGARARHVHDIHRATVGDTLRVGQVGGLVGQGIVTAIDRDEVALAVTLSEPPPAPAGVDLLLAMPRPKMLRRLLAAIASIGVKRLVLINSARVEKSYFDSAYLTPVAVDDALRLGLSQARDTILPQVSVEPRFRPFVEDHADATWPEPAHRLVAHPAADRDLSQAWPAGGTVPIVLAVGPEGGWVPFEVELLEAHRFRPFTAGARVLRVDTAVAYLLGQCALIRSRASW